MVSESSSSDDDAERNPKPDPNSIDQSLDAIENQLASISMSQSVSEPDSESESDHSVNDSTKELRNGSLNEIEQLSFHSTFSGDVSGVGEEVEVEVKVEGQEEQEQELEVPEASSSRVWRKASEVEDVEAPSSPSSSGYAGERGSTSSTSGIEEINDNGSEIHEVQNDGEFDEVTESQTPWVPGKRHGDEDEASVSWRKRKKHFFVLSHSGKPIYSRYGDEHKLAGFSATLQAIISYVENGGDRVKSIRAGKHQVNVHPSLWTMNLTAP